MNLFAYGNHFPVNDLTDKTRNFRVHCLSSAAVIAKEQSLK